MAYCRAISCFYRRSRAEQRANAGNSKFGVMNRLDLRFVGPREEQQVQRRKKTASQTVNSPGFFFALRAGVDFWGGEIPPLPLPDTPSKTVGVCTEFHAHY
jgi:hypothetical protein